jgi:hypothetical protein
VNSTHSIVLDEAEPELPRLRPADRRLPDRRRGDRGENTDIATVPIAKEAAGCQFVVTEPFPAKGFGQVYSDRSRRGFWYRHQVAKVVHRSQERLADAMSGENRRAAPPLTR